MKLKCSVLAFLATVNTATPLTIRNNVANGTNGTMTKSFKDIPLSKHLQWSPCFEKGFACVNLEVPLDYDDPSAGTTNIAFLKWATPNQPAMGDIIFNPGGPGDSAVEFVLNEATRNMLTGLFGTSYNIIGMDPRGVDNSGPDTACFSDKPALRDYSIYSAISGFDPASPQAMKAMFQSAGARGDWCSRTLGSEASYANTPATARDMLQYAELLAESQGQPREQAKLNYYGASYGTTLGMTFAQLYPDRVGRFIIDAVMDLDDHYGGAWMTNLLQADEAVESFNTFCFEAGVKCPFYRNDSSPAAIKTRVDSVLADLEENPIAVSDPTFVQFPTFVTHMDLRNVFLLSVYNPLAYFPGLALGLSDLEHKNGSLLAAGTGKGVMPPAECDNVSPVYNPVEPRLVIACNDMNGNYNISTMEKWYEYTEQLQNYSSYLGSSWSLTVTLQCRKLQVHPPKSQTWGGYKVTNTANPILFTDNKIDPVTSSYDKMAALFPGSVIMLQDALGHGMMAAASDCTTKYMTKFLETGELPPPATICDVPYNNPFDQPAGVPEKRGLMPRHLLNLFDLKR